MGTTARVAAFDRWIRSSFRDMNTELEEIYFAQDNRSFVQPVGGSIKAQLLEEGKRYIIDLLKEGNTDEGFDENFALLGDVGLYMGACRRHELTEPSREQRSPLHRALPPATLPPTTMRNLENTKPLLRWRRNICSWNTTRGVFWHTSAQPTPWSASCRWGSRTRLPGTC